MTAKGPMRKLIVSTLISLDGYVEGPSGSIVDLPIDGFFDEYSLERQQAADTLVLGRRTYEQFRGYWPAIADDPTRSPAVAADPRAADLHRSLARNNGRLRKLVVSDTLTPADTAPWQETTEIVARRAARERVAEERAGEGGDVLVFGSRTLWHDLLRAGLVDEVHVMVGAGLVGGGTPAFPDGVSERLRLLEARRRDGSGIAVLRYARVPGD